MSVKILLSYNCNYLDLILLNFTVPTTTIDASTEQETIAATFGEDGLSANIFRNITLFRHNIVHNVFQLKLKSRRI